MEAVEFYIPDNNHTWLETNNIYNITLIPQRVRQNLLYTRLHIEVYKTRISWPLIVREHYTERAQVILVMHSLIRDVWTITLRQLFLSAMLKHAILNQNGFRTATFKIGLSRTQFFSNRISRSQLIQKLNYMWTVREEMADKIKEGWILRNHLNIK